MSAVASSQTTRSSTSSQPSPALSAARASGYSKSWEDPGEGSSTASQKSEPDHRGLHHGRINGTQGEDGNNGSSPSSQSEQLVNRRHRPRNSGGFLLDPAFPPPQRSDMSKHIDEEGEMDTKGKRRADERRTTSGKRRLIARLWHDRAPRAPRAPSPLAASTNASDAARAGRGAEAEEAISGSRKDGDDSTTGTMASTEIQTDVTLDHIASNGLKSRPAVGMHLEPAQLVQMALSLGENRRRNVSLGRAAPIQTAMDNRRTISAELLIPGQSWRNSLQTTRSQRRASHLRDLDSSPGVVRRSFQEQPLAHSTALPIGQHSNTGSSSGEGEPAFSTATLARAENARAHIELFYEYRRLLQFLRPLKPDSTHPGNYNIASYNAPGGQTDLLRTDSFENNYHELGRAYNPLQYLRNRRVRISKHQGLDGDAAGWNNIGKVKAWVDQVGKAAAEPEFHSEDYAALPEFDVDRAWEDRDKNSPEKVRRHSLDRESRSSEDWEIRPSDLLADAYWLEQDDNKLLVEDRNGRKPFRHSRKKGKVRRRRDSEFDSGSSPRTPSKRGRYRTLSTTSTLPSLEGTDIENGLRRRKRDVFRAPLDKAAGFTKLGRRHRSLSASARFSPSYSSDDGSFKGERYRPQIVTAQVENVGPFEKRMLARIEAKRGISSRKSTEHIDATSNNSHAREGEQDPKTKFPSISSETTNFTIDTVGSGPNPEPSEDTTRDYEYRNSISSSPDADGQLLKPSPSENRRTSPAKKSKKTVFGRFKRHRSKVRNNIEEIDFAVAKNKAARSSSPGAPSSELQGTTTRDEQTDESFSPAISRSGSKDRRGDREPEPGSTGSRLLKIGRLADIVRLESFGLGGSLRKDSAGTGSSSARGSLDASDWSDNEGILLNPSTKLATNGLTRMSTETSRRNKLARKTTDKFKYVEKLPKFKPLSQPQDESTTPSPEEDHVWRQQKAQKDRSRPGRFHRLPKIDVSDRASLSSPDLARTLSNPTDGPYGWRESGLGRLESIPSRSNSGVRASARRLNSALEVPAGDTIWRSNRSTLGVPELSPGVSPSGRSPGRPTLDGKRHWSISDRARAEAKPRAVVTKRDLAYVRALLLSSGIKARELARRAHEPENPIPSFLRQASQSTHTPLKACPRSEQYPAAARILSTDLEHTLAAFRGSVSRFSSQICSDYRHRLTDLRDKCDMRLMPQARTCADDSDALMAELNTTYRLGVKQVNDAVEGLLRLRQRRMRWLRSGGWVLLEWLLLGVMWLVWAVVVLLKAVKRGIVGVLNLFRWILWL